MTKFSAKLPTTKGWAFTRRFRSHAFGWRGSDLAAQCLKETVVELRDETAAILGDIEALDMELGEQMA